MTGVVGVSVLIERTYGSIKNKLYEVEIGDLAKSPVSVVVNGERFDVELVDGLPQVSRAPSSTPVPDPSSPSPAQTSPAALRPQSSAGSVITPMPGKIVAIKVSPGDRVSAGDELVVLEAMKMEQSIRSPSDGVVKEIIAKEGQAVAHGDILLVLE